MKLLFCEECWDLFKLAHELRSCACGRVSGHYIDHEKAVVNGKGVSLAIGNGSLWNAIRELRYGAKGVTGERIEVLCWVRHHEGPTNPNTTVREEVGNA